MNRSVFRREELTYCGKILADLVPSGSYAVRASPLDPELLQDVSSPSTFLEAAAEPVTRSPHLLSVGKAVLELAQLLQDIRKRNCPRATAALCAMQRFNPGSRQEMRNADVYTALRIIARSHSIRYLVAMKSQRGDVVDMAAYNVEPANMKFRVSAESRMPKMPRLCLKKYARNCDGCANFKKRFGPRGKGNPPFLSFPCLKMHFFFSTNEFDSHERGPLKGEKFQSKFQLERFLIVKRCKKLYKRFRYSGNS